MTIASCLVMAEGVIFGADSTTSADLEYGYHYLNHNQKLFEIGENSSLAIMTWGLSSFGDISYRTLIARLADELATKPPQNVAEVANRWLSSVWDAYQTSLSTEIAEFRALEVKQISAAASKPDDRSLEDDERYLAMKDNLFVGFCIGGYCLPDREPRAYWFELDPTLRSPSSPLPVEAELFKGQPDVFRRLYDGFDYRTRETIHKSPFWSGTESDLDEILGREMYIPPQMTVRDGIDFVHFSIYSTIKALKFSAKGQVCGGPIELAVITTDRAFRWVRHKTWDSAVGYDGP